MQRAVWALVGALLSAGVLAGCGGSSARRYAVTVLEPAKIDCKATARVGEATVGKERADQIEKDWTDFLQGAAPTPVGRVLQVTESDDERVRAWFDAPVSLNIDPFGSPEEVMSGDVHDDYVEVTWRRVAPANDEELAEALGIESCGELEHLAFTMSVTVDGSDIEGRVRRVRREYMPLGISPCDETVTCPRDLQLSGVEIDE
jgi:hypothetical protein